MASGNAVARALAESRQLRAEWNKQPSFGLAIDMLNLSTFSDTKSALVAPATFLLEQHIALPEALTRKAKAIAGLQDPYEPPVTVQRSARSAPALRRLRTQLANYPNDPIAWVDLAREHVIQGSTDKAEKCIETALQLAPDSRFVLRSAARYFSHIREHERAAHVLKKSKRTPLDPWLLATAISLQAILNKTDDARRGAKMLDDKRFAPPDTSELACALGSLELSNGQYKNSRKLLSQGLIAPNDNSVAQALWVVSTFNFPIEAREEWLTGDFAAEARVYRHSADGHFKNALSDTLTWAEDEPFSSRPWVNASYLAGLLLDWDDAILLAKAGLQKEPSDVALRNNLAYALMGKGELETATVLLSKLVKEEQAESRRPSGHTMANVAMHSYRTGDLALGERLYRQAFKDFAGRGLAGSEAAAMVLVNLAKEAKLAKASNATALANEARQYTRKNVWPSAALGVQQLDASESMQEEVVPDNKKRNLVSTATKWHYDAEKNVLVLESRKPFR